MENEYGHGEERRVSQENEELPATDKQVKFLQSLAYSGITRKQASQAITILKGGE